MDTVKRFVPLLVIFLLSLACNLPSVSIGRSRSTVSEAAATLASVDPLAGDEAMAATLTPTPIPTPTPPPAARVTQGDRAIFNGDWDSALGEYRAALEASADPEVKFAARLGIGHTQYLAGDYAEAQGTLESLVSEESETPHIADAYFFLAQTYDEQEMFVEAAEAYSQYLALRPGLIDGLVHELRGEALFAAGDYPGAIAAYQAALGAAHLSTGFEIEIKMAQAYDLSGDLATALVAYQDIYDRTPNDYTKAQMDFLLGQAYAELGQMDQAYAAYLDAVENYPLAYDSYLALLNLVEAGVPVDELDRGLVDYFTGQYAVAVAAFDRYLQSGPLDPAEPEDPATALYYKGLALRGLGEQQTAIESWDQLIKDYPEDNLWAKAWEQKADSLWYDLGEYRQATGVLLDFVAAAPTHERAAEFLFDAASIAERGERLGQAAKLWERTASEYPSSEQTPRALFLAGITRYRLADYVAAHALFQQLLAQSGELEQRAAAFFWMGKSQEVLGDRQAARVAWEQAASLDPTGYYSERARDLLSGVQPFTAPRDYDLSFDLEAERAEAEDWMRTIFDLPAETDLSEPGSLAQEPRFQRGNELWRLGLYNDARAEFEDLRMSVEDDPADTYRLANHLIDLGLYRSGILAVRRVLTLAGMDDAETMSAPIFFNHVRFGPYFRELIIPVSQEYNFHPLFLFSVMRQESLFEGFVRSAAGARGLMQIVPNTGQELATNADWPPDYTAEDLYRPQVSIKLGVDYLNRQRGFFAGDLYAMLAAYNGGPGNAIIWKGLVPPDPDLFLEAIRFEETRNYIKRIYEIFNIYKRLYDRTP